MKRWYKLFAVAWTLLILLLSSLHPSALHLPDFWDLFSLDKLAHATFYAILFYLWAGAIHDGRKNIYIMLLLLCIAYGGAIELYQGFILTDRTADCVDELANAIGTVGGFVIWNRRQKKY